MYPRRLRRRDKLQEAYMTQINSSQPGYGVRGPEDVPCNACTTIPDNVARSMSFMEAAESVKAEIPVIIQELFGLEREKDMMANLMYKAQEYKATGLYLDSSGKSGLDASFVRVCNEYGITLPNSAKDAAGGWDNAIARMQTKLDEIGGGIQKMLEKVHDCIGQYNSLLQSAGDAVGVRVETGGGTNAVKSAAGNVSISEIFQSMHK